MAKLRSSEGAVISLLGGLAQGVGDARRNDELMAQQKRRLDLAERQVAMDESYQKGRQEERERLLAQEDALLQMDYLQSEGLGNKEMLKGRASAQAGMAVAGQVLGGSSAGLQALDPAMQKAQADIARWNESFKGMNSHARGLLLQDMARVRDGMEQQRQFARHKDLLTDKVQMLRGTEGQFEGVDPALDMLRKQIGEAESPEELDQLNEALDRIVLEEDTRASNKAASEKFRQWADMQGGDTKNMSPALANAVARGEMNGVEARSKFLQMNEPEVFRASKAEVLKREAREHALRIKKDAHELALKSFGDFGPPDEKALFERTRQYVQFLGGSMGSGPVSVPRGALKGEGARAPGAMSPEAAAAWGAAGVPPEEAWERARAGEAPPGVEPAPAAKPKERKGAIVSAARALKAAPGRIASNTGLGVLARGTKAAVELTDEQYPLVVKDVSEALKEFGVDISPKELEKKVPRPKGGLLSSLLELLREPAETDFTPAPY